jgi:peptidylprolyl isomerase
LKEDIKMTTKKKAGTKSTAKKTKTTKVVETTGPVTTAETGNTVTLHYKGTLDDGSEFDSSYARDPMQVVVGSGQLISGFDSALVGMTEGQTKTFTLTPDEAYGDTDPDNVADIGKDMFPEDFDFTEGRVVPLMGPGGQQFLATVTSEDDDTVTVDLNHPMAGKSLTFAVEVLTVDSTIAVLEDNTAQDETIDG